MSRYDSNDEMSEATKWVFWFVGIVVVIGLFFVFVYNPVVGRKVADTETRVTRESIGYQETKATALRTRYEDYKQMDVMLAQNRDDAVTTRALKAQQKAVLIQMRADADKVSPDMIPSDIRAFLGENQ